MPKISDHQREARREQIISAAWKCFYRRGIHATSMEEIIREAHLSSGAVYLYFKSKEELILTAISTYMGNLRGLLAPLLQSDEPAGPAKLIHDIISVLVRFTGRRGINLNSIILMCWSEAQSNSKVKSVVRKFQVGYRAALSELVVKWQQAGEVDLSANPDDVAKALLAIFMGFIAQSALVGEVDPDTIARGLQYLCKSGAQIEGQRKS